MIEVIKPGLFTTVQDSGRNGYTHIGVSTSGFMDTFSARLANSILDNKLDAALLECTYTGPQLKFQAPTTIAFTGAIAEIYKNEKLCQHNVSISIRAGDQISIGAFRIGCRLYMAVKNGLLTEKILGSRSVNITSGLGRKIMKGDILPCSASEVFIEKRVEVKRKDVDSDFIRVKKGLDSAMFSKELFDSIEQTIFTVGVNSNRMAYGLESDEDEFTHTKTILSSPTIPGTVQLTQAGQFIVLMRDAQTTGGYPRILQFDNDGINQLSQKKARQIVRFKLS